MPLQYVPFASSLDLSFYSALFSHKLNTDKLDSSARKLLGLYEIRPSDPKERSCRMHIPANALTNSDDVPAGFYRAEGIIRNVNTMEEYRALDKAKVLRQAGATVWEAICDGTIYSCPSLLAGFVVIGFADLKKWRFSYWFAFPALVSEPSWRVVGDGERKGQGVPVKTLTAVESTALVDKVQTWRYAVDNRQHGFFLAKKNRRAITRVVSEDPDPDSEPEQRPVTPKTPTATLGYSWEIASLSTHESGFFEGEYAEDCFVCFADPSNYGEPGVAPGWMMRNLLVLIRQRWKRDRVQILCYRDVQSRRDAARTVILDMQLHAPTKTPTPAPHPDSVTDSMPKVVGWERDAGHLRGKMTDMKEYMDPTRLADQSVDLNLKLMKWRISPNLNLDQIKETKCLLLGAGTLGSYVSRNLMGWGVRHITFVDNGLVSFSNPVRQPLFTFNDCLDGGAQKAVRAAAALKEIYPGVVSSGNFMSVPMAGHPITDATKTKSEFEKLQELIDTHDAIFLLMDTRESRWLPTVMGKAAGKIVMTSALGFDTFVVMRHGVHADTDEGGLGCYFCNDVVAPADSLKDQTLDQQCTVTRPGIAAIASALLVELLVSILQHPLGAAAPASTSSADDRGDHPLGLVPHQIRGFLSTFQNMSITGRSYNCCSACSDRILDAYKTEGWEFVRKALNEKGYVEELSGLAEVQRKAEAAEADIDFDEEDEDAEEGEGELL